MVEIVNHSELIGNFDYTKYCKHILGVFPEKYIRKLEGIWLVDEYVDYIKCDTNGYGCYFVEKGGNGVIVLHISNLTKSKIPPYLYFRYPEIASFFLSEIIGHEFGHHILTFWLNGGENHEEFADYYAAATYYNYFKKRKFLILFNYCCASCNYLLFDREDRRLFRNAIKDLLNWKENKYKNMSEE